MVGGAIYTLSPDENRLCLRPPVPQAQPIFLSFQMLLPSPVATAFETATLADRITHFAMQNRVPNGSL